MFSCQNRKVKVWAVQAVLVCSDFTMKIWGLNFFNASRCPFRDQGTTFSWDGSPDFWFCFCWCFLRLTQPVRFGGCILLPALQFVQKLVILGEKTACNLKNVTGVMIILMCSCLKAVVLSGFLKVIENVIFKLEISFWALTALSWHVFLRCRTAGVMCSCVCLTTRDRWLLVPRIRHRGCCSSADLDSWAVVTAWGALPWGCTGRSLGWQVYGEIVPPE